MRVSYTNFLARLILLSRGKVRVHILVSHQSVFTNYIYSYLRTHIVTRPRLADYIQINTMFLQMQLKIVRIVILVVRSWCTAFFNMAVSVFERLLSPRGHVRITTQMAECPFLFKNKCNLYACGIRYAKNHPTSYPHRPR